VPSLKRNFFFQFLLAFTQVAFPLITYPYLARTLEPSGIGKVGYIEFIAGLIITIFSVGIPYYGVREIARLKNNIAGRGKTFLDLISIHLLTSLAGMAFFFVVLSLNKSFDDQPLLYLGALYILLQAFSVEWYLQGTEAFDFIAIRSIVIRIVGIIAIFLFVKTKTDFIIYYGIITATQLLVSIVSLSKAIAENNFTKASIQLQPHFKPLLYFFLTTTFISTYVFFDTIILGFLTTEEHVGYYTFSLRIVKLPLLLLLTFNTVLYPRISFLQTEKMEDEAKKYQIFTADLILTLTIPLTVCFYFLAPEIISLLGGAKFYPSIPVLQILAPLPFVISLSNFFFLQVLSPQLKEKRIMLTVLLGSMLSIGLNYLLIPSLKEKGAAIAALTTESFVCILLAIFSWQHVKVIMKWKTFISSSVLSVFVLPITILCKGQFNQPLMIILSTILFFGIIYILVQAFLLRNMAMRAALFFKKNCSIVNR